MVDSGGDNLPGIESEEEGRHRGQPLRRFWAPRGTESKVSPTGSLMGVKDILHPFIACLAGCWARAGQCLGSA